MPSCGNPYSPGSNQSGSWSFTKKYTVPQCATPPPDDHHHDAGHHHGDAGGDHDHCGDHDDEGDDNNHAVDVRPPTTRPKAFVIPAANDSDLPDTGADVAVPLLLGVLLLAGGIIVLRYRIQN